MHKGNKIKTHFQIHGQLHGVRETRSQFNKNTFTHKINKMTQHLKLFHRQKQKSIKF